jgi:hypothetical protein
MFGFLHFDNKLFALFTLAVEIEDCFAIKGSITKVFGTAVGEIFDPMLGW